MEKAEGKKLESKYEEAITSRMPVLRRSGYLRGVAGTKKKSVYF